MTHAELVATLERLVQRVGSQKALAQKLGVSEAYLSDVLGGRPPGRKLLDPLGLERVTTTTYERKAK